MLRENGGRRMMRMTNKIEINYVLESDPSPFTSCASPFLYPSLLQTKRMRVLQSQDDEEIARVNMKMRVVQQQQVNEKTKKDSD